MLKSRKKTTNSSPNNTTDLDRYLNIDLISFEDDEDFDILIWWKSQQHKYPVLSIIARDVLTVPVSTVALEAAFSAGGRVVSDKRYSLAPDSIEANICVKDWTIADKRIFDSIQEENMLVDMEKLKSSRSSWISDSSPSPPRDND
ncbi:hypothetical protein VitviT2T_003718 [Vitis vinifera]|uniref:HAT C-terminal dimerisation domain-containing protein n=1 Tax=Vitis vinifera TaxID=29760 RepID=A0ABY9BN34_VITVI|nr:hypothetical protein VitviT2T_003718 [Vitis vinifera]